MSKKIIIILILTISVVAGAIFVYNKSTKTSSEDIIKQSKNSDIQNNQTTEINRVQNNTSSSTNSKQEISKVESIKIRINNNELNVKLENNSSVDSLIEKLKEGDITVNAHEYGGFEKIGNLGFNLPTNDTQIKATAGDLILYQGNQISLFYGSNSWSYTRLGKIIGTSESELKNILGSGDVTLVLSID